MAKVDIERAYAKCLEEAPLTRAELNELLKMGLTELIEYGTVTESSHVRMWVRHERYRQRAQDLYNNRDPEDDGRGFKTPPKMTYPFYETD